MDLQRYNDYNDTDFFLSQTRQKRVNFSYEKHDEREREIWINKRNVYIVIGMSLVGGSVLKV